jgi:hypothetical protein
MDFSENVTIELASDGMIVRGSLSVGNAAERYFIGDASQYTNDGNEGIRTLPLRRLWLIWFGSLPLLTALIWLSRLLLG